jgi:hypothetical protein
MKNYRHSTWNTKIRVRIFDAYKFRIRKLISYQMLVLSYLTEPFFHNKRTNISLMAENLWVHLLRGLQNLQKSFRPRAETPLPHT